MTVTETEAAAEQPSTEAVDEPGEGESEDARVEIEDEGIGQAGESVSYGLVLRNTSSEEDALDLTVSVNILDRAGTILATDSNTLSLIPAGETFYFGSETYLEQGGKAAKLDPLVEVGYGESAGYPLPEATRVRVTRDDFGSVEVRGEVHNTLDSTLASFARVSIVLFSKSGDIVGGAYTYLNADLPPGRRAGFNAYITAAPSRAIANAKVSVENVIAE